MTWLYAFMLAAGAPLLLWFAFAGGEADVDGGAEIGGGDSGALADVFSVVPISTLAMFATFFGGIGLVATLLGVNPALVLLLALVVGVITGALNSVVFGFLRGSEASSDVSDREIEGTIGRVALPVSSEHRGRIVLTVGGARSQMTAAPVDFVEADKPIEPGARVIVVRVEGGVALVTRLDPELE